MYDLQLPTVALRPGLGLVHTVHIRRLRRKQQQLRDTARVRGRVCERHRDLRGAGPEVGVRRGAGGGAVPRPGAAILPRPRHAHVSAVPVRRLRRQPQQLRQRGGVRGHVRRPRQGHVWAAGGPRALLQLPDQVTTTSPRPTSSHSYSCLAKVVPRLCPRSVCPVHLGRLPRKLQQFPL